MHVLPENLLLAIVAWQLCKESVACMFGYRVHGQVHRNARRLVDVAETEWGAHCQQQRLVESPD